MKTGSRKEHRNAAVMRRQAHAKDVADHFLKRAVAEKEAFEAPRVFMVDTPSGPHAQFGCALVETPADLRPTSEDRARFWRLTFGAIKLIYWGVLGGMVAVAILAVAFVAIMKTAGY